MVHYISAKYTAFPRPSFSTNSKQIRRKEKQYLNLNKFSLIFKTIVATLLTIICGFYIKKDYMVLQFKKLQMTGRKLVCIFFALRTFTKINDAANAFSLTVFICFCFRTEKQLLCISTLTSHSKH